MFRSLCLRIDIICKQDVQSEFRGHGRGDAMATGRHFDARPQLCMISANFLAAEPRWMYDRRRLWHCDMSLIECELWWMIDCFRFMVHCTSRPHIQGKGSAILVTNLSWDYKEMAVGGKEHHLLWLHWNVGTRRSNTMWARYAKVPVQDSRAYKIFDIDAWSLQNEVHMDREEMQEELLASHF